ncbi:MAG: helicase-related protein [Hyphomicrobiaceae bacterium]
MAQDNIARIRHVTAVLGPTNTGKTHLAIERMLGHRSGMIGLPLRLLAREVYDRVVQRVGPGEVALITGEEKIKPETARFWICTVEAMPPEIDVDFLAIDEIQLAADPERGHVFTDRLLHARGRMETLVLGAATMRDAIADLIPGSNFISRPRLSRLAWSGQKKLTRLPARSAIVAFSAADVYAIAELIRSQRGGAAVVLGALSPRTRNAQVALYQSGDVEYMVATDAIGMGLNLDVDHVAFAAVRKFDGYNHRNLTPAELSQIAGRAGRHMNDGTFGVTADVEPFDQDLVDRLENHTFDPLRTLQWRARDLDFRSVEALRDSLRAMPRHERLMRARMADDVLALETLSTDRDILALATSPAAVERLWGACQVPDYRKISPQAHAELVGTLFKYVSGPDGRIDEDWFAKQVAFADRTDGDIDTLSNRLAHIRTWTFVAQRPDWLKDPAHWQDRTRAIEDALSDALHECLTQRFVDRRTSALMKGLKAKDDLTADIGDDGAIMVESHFVGRLQGFRFFPDTHSDNVHGKATRHAAAQVLAKEIAMRARRVSAAKSDAFKLARNGRVLWRDAEIARLLPGDDMLKPQFELIADEHLQAADREKVSERLKTWLAEIISTRLKPLADIQAAEDLTGLGRGVAFRLLESLGVLRRETVAEEMKSLDQAARAQLRRYGVRFGAFNIFFPLLLKPASAELVLTLWALKHGAQNGLDSDALPEPPRAGLTSVPSNAATPEAFYRVIGFQVCGPRAVRIDILERLADLIRPLLAWRAKPDNPSAPPKGATGEGGFMVIPEMMSILGCSPDELASVLKALGFRIDRKPASSLPQLNAEPGATDRKAAEAALSALAAAASGAPLAGVAAAVSDSPAVAVAASPEASAGGATSAEATVDAVTAAEPEMVEIWRPRRRHEHEEREGRQRGARHAGRPGSARSEAASGGVERQHQRPDRQRGFRAREQTATQAGAPEGNEPREHGNAKGARKEHQQRGYVAREDARSGRPPDKSGEGRRDRGSRPGGDRRRDDRDHGKSRVISATPPRQKAADPDSPFAALGALKLALEAKGRDPKSSS